MPAGREFVGVFVWVFFFIATFFVCSHIFLSLGMSVKSDFWLAFRSCFYFKYEVSKRDI